MADSEKDPEGFKTQIAYLNDVRKSVVDISIELIEKGLNEGRCISELRNAADSLSKQIDTLLKNASGDMESL